MKKNEQFRKIIYYHEKNMSAAKLKWENISKQNDTSQELLFEERILSENTGLKCGELTKELKDTEKQLEEACTNLQALVTDGNVLCANEVKRIHMSREYEIEKLKLQSDVSNKTNTNLLKSYKEMNVELHQSNK